MPATAAAPYALTNPLSLIVDKPREDFTRGDLLRVIEEKQIERLTFHYTGLDGKYKELRLPVADEGRAGGADGSRPHSANWHRRLHDSGD